MNLKNRMTCNFLKLFLSREKRKFSCISHLEHWNYLSKDSPCCEKGMGIWNPICSLNCFSNISLPDAFVGVDGTIWAPCPQVLFAPVTGVDVFRQRKVMPFRETFHRCPGNVSPFCSDLSCASPLISVVSVSVFCTGVYLLHLHA